MGGGRHDAPLAHVGSARYTSLDYKRRLRSSAHLTDVWTCRERRFMTTSPSHRTPLSTIVRERWLTIVLVMVTIAFVAQNRNRVDLNMFWIHVRWPLWLVLVAMAIVGAALGLAVGRRRRR